MITELFADQGLIPLYAVCVARAGIYTAETLTQSAQFEGLRVRAPNINTQRFVDYLSGSPHRNRRNRIFTSFSALGRVDAMITSSSTGSSMAAWDYVTDYTNAEPVTPKNIIFMSQRSFDGLDKRLRTR